MAPAATGAFLLTEPVFCEEFRHDGQIAAHKMTVNVKMRDEQA